MSTLRCILLVIVALGVYASSSAAQWNAHTVQQLNGTESPVQLPAQRQIVTEDPGPWLPYHQVVAVPSLVYMPEVDRLLITVGADNPHQATVITSDDHGVTWSQPRYLHTDGGGNSDVGLSTGLTYLGNGKLVINGGANRWFSQDYGETWGNPVAVAPAPDGKSWYDGWSPTLVDRNAQTGEVSRLVETGYGVVTPGHQQAYLRTSTDLGITWDSGITVPQWDHISEVALVRAANNDIVAACRTDSPPEHEGGLDHYEGLGVSVSHDDGATWSPVTKLYDYGRHHPSLLVMPNDDIVMTYVVRKGYPDTAEGYPQFGIEAVVSHDNGETWDLDNRYVLDSWVGTRPSSNPSTSWYASSQATSSVLLPDGSIMTSYGTGYREAGMYNGTFTPRDVGAVLWRPSPTPEPSSLVLAGTGLLMLAGFTLRRRKHRTHSNS